MSGSESERGLWVRVSIEDEDADKADEEEDGGLGIMDGVACTLLVPSRALFKEGVCSWSLALFLYLGAFVLAQDFVSALRWSHAGVAGFFCFTIALCALICMSRSGVMGLCFYPSYGFVMIMCWSNRRIWDLSGDVDVGFSLPLIFSLAGDPLLKDMALVLQGVLSHDPFFLRPLFFVLGVCLALFSHFFGGPLKGCQYFFFLV
ncbi:hypothetical protein SUGI_0697050 [Cryptomeria japonica]|nr:hypothetical protein SUGI_0697050 [Cryptomeria japonica]